MDEFFRNQIERRVVLGGEARPVRRIRTAGAAGLARALDVNSWTGCLPAFLLEHDSENWQPALPRVKTGRLAVPARQVSLGGSQTRLLRHLALSKSRRSGYFSSRCTASMTRSVRKLRKSLRNSHHAASSRTAPR